MEWVAWARAVAALVATLALIGLAAWAARRYGLLSGAAPRRERRLKVIESLMLDPRRRLVIVQHDEREHLLLLSPAGDRVVIANTRNAPASEAP